MSNSEETHGTTRPEIMLEERIRQRAYELYEKRLRCSDVDDWLDAEREVLSGIQQEKGSGTTASPIIPDVTTSAASPKSHTLRKKKASGL